MGTISKFDEKKYKQAHRHAISHKLKETAEKYKVSMSTAMHIRKSETLQDYKNTVTAVNQAYKTRQKALAEPFHIGFDDVAKVGSDAYKGIKVKAKPIWAKLLGWK